MSFQGSKINPTKYDRSQIKFFVILVPLALFMALPIVYLISTALKPIDELFAFPPRFLVTKPTLENFTRIFRFMDSSGIPFTRYLVNTLGATLLTVVGTLLISITSAYVLSKKRFKAKKALFSLNTLALMFVPAATSIPRYLMMERVNIIDTFWALVLPSLAMPVGMFLIKQYTDQVPDSLIEAAYIDGARDFYIIRRIVMPIIKPAIATVAILSFQASWNEAELAKLYVTDESLRTFALLVSTITDLNSGNIVGAGMAAAGSLILFIPNLIIFIIMQSKIINTMAHSGIK